MRHASIPTVLGDLLLVADGDALAGLYFPGHRYPPAAGSIGDEDPAAAIFGDVAHQLDEYFAGSRRAFDVPLALHGDDFSQSVWTTLRAIPFGETTTYGAIARALGNPHLAQRVGQAVGHNPISIIVPCHRVLGADGALTGFAGGLARKRHLLDLEEPDAVRATRLF
ncbi:methylated-DNA--[protein]-cysteine S-methyltransferase [Rathayibacter oskolensis]|uniref:methylated-DNA--[protein]-cysteine S-methyltransferase n=1 Tax=Rathayibacter TaxID=33886 RepID=UPI001317F3F1|nr:MULTISPECIES: methylated-DNA--[protein]-cysteine S-methyltransferase [Rathayibacter]QHC67358.1 methylated-DNA--[protein]-cysteine S-methyltransferase [Rathayibacter sp. VKM Ac-2759]WKK71927.1 methylated-DNA--[protein]-cysteine S-methyltransferase [Rathayibacter oskolensis]